MTQSLTRFRDIPPKVNPNVKVLTSSCVEIVNIWTPLFAIARIAKTQQDSSMTFICMGQPPVSRLCQQTRQGQLGYASTRFAADTLPPRPEGRSCTKRPIKRWVNSSVTSRINVRRKLDGLIVIRATARQDLDERCLFAVIDPGFAEHVIPCRVLDLTRMHCPQSANVFAAHTEMPASAGVESLRGRTISTSSLRPLPECIVDGSVTTSSAVESNDATGRNRAQQGATFLGSCPNMH